MPQLSTRQEQILNFLRGYQAHRNYMPSVREIQVACSISSTSVVDYNLRLLERAGHIRRWPDISRAIELVDEERPKLEDAATVPALGAYAAKDRGRAPLPARAHFSQRRGPVRTEGEGLPEDRRPRRRGRYRGLGENGKNIDDFDAAIEREPDLARHSRGVNKRGVNPDGPLRPVMDRDADYQDLELGPLLRRLRRGVSLREVQRLAGVSYAHLSLIERGDRIPGPRILKRLAALYGIGAHDLLKRAGYLESEGEGPRPDETLEVERAYRYVLADPKLRLCTRPSEPLPLATKRFIVEMYERLSGKRLLE